MPADYNANAETRELVDRVLAVAQLKPDEVGAVDCLSDGAYLVHYLSPLYQHREEVFTGGKDLTTPWLSRRVELPS